MMVRGRGERPVLRLSARGGWRDGYREDGGMASGGRLAMASGRLARTGGMASGRLAMASGRHYHLSLLRLTVY